MSYLQNGCTRDTIAQRLQVPVNDPGLGFPIGLWQPICSATSFAWPVVGELDELCFYIRGR